MCWAPRARLPQPSLCSKRVEQRRRRRGRDAAPRRARPGIGRGATCMCATALACSADAEQQRGTGRARRSSRRARPGMGLCTTCVRAPAIALLGWRGAAAEEGRARRRSPPTKAREEPEHHVRVCPDPRAAWLTRSISGERGGRDAASRRARPFMDWSTPLPAGHHVRVCACPRAAQLTQNSRGGGGVKPLPAGRGDVCACPGPRAAWLTRSSGLGGGGGRDTAPRRARPGMGRSTTCVCATALALLG